ncbi:MAG: efflux RND transporter periplasmic adaptor subunit [Rhodoferax sp.]
MQAQQSGGGSKPVASASRAAAPADGARAARPPSAEILIVQPRLLVDSVQAIGTVRARRSVMLRPEVPGRVVALPFKDGAPVRKGQPMVQLDDRVQRAELQQMQAQLTIAETNFRRTQELTDANFVSRQARDSAAANLDVAKAQLALSQARLERMTIRAPFDGVAGIRQVEVGDYVKDGSNLVAVEDPHDRVVDFTLPQRRAAQVRLGLPVEVRLHEAPGAPVLLGRIEAIEPQQDPTSRALSLRARLLPPAAAGSSAAPALRAGMAVGVTVEFGRNPKALMVPEESIVPQNGQQFVVRALPLAGADTACAGDCVAGAGGVRWRSQRQVVSLGTRLDGWVEVVEGLSATDRVVTAGQQRLLKDGTVFVELPSAERSHGTKAAARGASAVGANRAPATPTAASAAGRS